MRAIHDKVLTHAALLTGRVEQLSDPREITARLRTFLKIESQRLKMAHRCGASGRQTATARSLVLDQAVRCAFLAASWPDEGGEFLGGARNGCALVAIGGYGRAELAPLSDLDLLFLHTGRRSEQMRKLVERVLRLLWDAGLSVGHSFRTVRESVAAARVDTHFQTALLHPRLLAGNGALMDCLLHSLERERRQRTEEFLLVLRRERDARHAKFGASVCLQEPNIKESAGGLRDLHTALWAAHASYGCRTLDELRARELISEAEHRSAVRAYDLLWRVRHASHLLTGRKTDRIALDMQPALAEEFGYHSTPHLLASEKFMRDYYRRALSLHVFSESLFARASEKPQSRLRLFRRPRAERLAEPFEIGDGRLLMSGSGNAQFLKRNPLLVFDAFALAQAAHVPFGNSLQEAVRRSLAFVNRDFRASTDAARAFLKILRRRGRVGFALRQMHEVGFLGRYLPEFGRISLLIQHDLYHHYTIDEHTLRAVEALDDLYNRRARQKSANLRAAFDQIEDPALVYLSVLLHDIGKGGGRGHILRGMKIAGRVCQRLHLEAHESALIELMVEHHVTMAHLALRRDLNEPQVAEDFAARIGSLDGLNMLLLLTYADLNGVGPGVWSDWKGALLWELYRRARTHLTSEDALPPEAQEETAWYSERVVASLAGEIPPSEVERHLALLPERYTRVNSPEGAAAHLRLIAQLDGDALQCRWRPHGSDSTELTVCTRDRHALFADLAGTLASCGLEILSAEVNTREDGIAIDVFMLCQAPARSAVEVHKYAAIEGALRSAVTGASDVVALVERWRKQSAPRRHRAHLQTRRRELPRVFCDNDASPVATVIEIHAADEPGLAYKIANALAALRLDIVCAKITTEKSDALDVFYVTDAEGMKLSEEAMRAIETCLAKRLSASGQDSEHV